MKIEKLPSGNYRIQKMINGKRYSFTFEHRPTKNEIALAVNEKIGKVNGKTTFETAAISYINSRNNTLSPTTVKEYHGTLKRLSRTFLSLPIDDITQSNVQKEINDLAVGRSPKTVRNYHGFIASVLGEYRPELVLHTHLPMRDKTEPYIPSNEEIKALLDYAHGTMYETAILLGCCSLRRSEVCALTPADVEGNTIHVNKAMVQDINKKWVIKKPKTTSSIRDVIVPDVVIDSINRNGLYTNHPNSITDWMDATEKKLKMKHFSFHKLRHYFASIAHEAGIPDADIMAAGGWQTDYVMKAIYRHSMAPDSSAATTAVMNNIF